MERIAELLEHETAGDPIRGLKWTRKTTRSIARQLRRLEINISPKTVGRLLKEMGFSLRVNQKRLESGNRKLPSADVRNRQFQTIRQMREEFTEGGIPVISVDTKKKEQIGNFKNGGVSWEKDPYLVMDHDFPSDAQGVLVPYGIYDPQANQGMIVGGTSSETAAFAVDALVQWWKTCGKHQYPEAEELLILADCGGGNSARSRAWKYHLQHKLCEPYHLMVTVCHYPPGASKWNPIEHRLFSAISRNWSGKPLESYEVALNYMATTRNSSGLLVKVNTRLMQKHYETGERVSDTKMDELFLLKHDPLPDWNYTLFPATM
jgi:hypothetical protein